MRPYALLLALGFAASCGGDPAPPDRSTTAPTVEAAPSRVEIAPPERRLRGAIDNEALAGVLDEWLESVGNKLRIRDFDGFGKAFASKLLAESLFPGEEDREETEILPLGIERSQSGAPEAILDRDEFLAAIEARVGPWARVSQSRWRVRSAEFERPSVVTGGTGLVRWGRVEVAIHIVGHGVGGTSEVLDARAVMRVANDAGTWTVQRMRMEEREMLRHGGQMFSEVSRAAGVAFDGLRFGEAGNDGDGWNGAASGDVDGDGLFDVFCPGASRGFFYRNLGDGRFAEEAEQRGLAGLGGGTGAVFFDVDRDGDQDLVVGRIGWVDLAGELAGSPIALLLNDGKGQFTDATEAFGLDELRLPAYGLTAFDADGDGWTDLFACGYGRMEFETNDNWIESTNGAPDLLLKNVDGKRFEDVTAAANIVDQRWSYASAAADFDEDGDMDLFVGNNFGTSRLWRNRGDGTFEDVAKALGVDTQGNVMGVLWSDLNGDGRLDLYLSSPTSTSGQRLIGGVESRGGNQALGRMIQMANGNKFFVSRWQDGEFLGFEPVADRGALHSGWAWSVASPDIDLDGARDLVCVNGFVTGELTGDT